MQLFALSPIKRVAIIGLGLIGGSLGMALTQGRIVEEVIGFDQEEEALSLALSTQTVHRVERNMAEAVQNADLVIMATPVCTYPSIVTTIKNSLRPGTIVTDVGSTKAWVMDQMKRLLPEGIAFVGGHPMAGSEKKGIRGADRYLLENAVYVLTPDRDTVPEAIDAVEAIMCAVGARVLKLSPSEHDQMVAVVSHLPHMVAVALVETLSEVAKSFPQASMLAAGGFRDTTRVAAGDPRMWVDIAKTNREPLLHTIGLFRQALDRLESEIGGCSSDGTDQIAALQSTLSHARDVRLAIPGKAKGVLPGIHEVVVTVPDKPGVIGNMARILGEAGINIADIEILRVRERDGGTIRIGFYEAEEADRAVEVLAASAVIVKRL
ncbi:prephenate dehydrogenase [Heliobacterium chlorum]|uniref:Prephenate dehydrogenase n=2 Tax=Heliobacterium chlorum TaxID=2698 RepID=A0ABR7SZS7_HELCL|nr:prephenate dehydrogenase [Heliobacterium chlorum]